MAIIEGNLLDRLACAIEQLLVCTIRVKISKPANSPGATWKSKIWSLFQLEKGK
jgi:hypothetical protein